MTRYRASRPPEEEEERGMNVCVVYGCLSNTSTSKSNFPLLGASGCKWRGKQLNMFIAGFEGCKLGAEA